jgi:hypothetical protein
MLLATNKLTNVADLSIIPYHAEVWSVDHSLTKVNAIRVSLDNSVFVLLHFDQSIKGFEEMVDLLGS